MEVKETRRRLRYADRRKQLLSIARVMIEADGLAGLTMTGLAERAAVAKPVVYTHFPSSLHVATALLDEHFAAINALFEQRVASAHHLAGYLRSVVEAALSFERISDTPIRKMINGFSAGDAINVAFATQERIFREHWRHLLVLLGVPWRSTGDAASILASMVNGAASTRTDSDPERRIATATAMLIAAIDAVCACSNVGEISRMFAEPIYDLIRRRQQAGETVS